MMATRTTRTAGEFHPPDLRRRDRWFLALVGGVLVVLAFFCVHLDAFSHFLAWSRRFEGMKPENWIPVAFLTPFFLLAWLHVRTREGERMAESCRRAESALREGRQRYKKLFDNILDIYCETTVDGTILDVSPSVEAISGYRPDELMGTNILAFYGAPQSGARLMDQLLLSGRVENFEVDFRTRDGRLRTGSMHCVLERRAEDGKPHRIYGTTRDVTSMKETMDALAASERKYRGIFGNIQDAYFELDRDGTLLEVSPAIRNLLGFEREALIGTRIADLHEDPTEQDRFASIASRGERLHDFELRLRGRDGRVRDVSVNCERIEGARDDEAWVVGSLRDISDRKRAEAALIESRNELEKRVSERTGELVASNRRLQDEIEERKRMASELGVREASFRVLTENSPDLVFRLDRAARVLFANEAATRVLGPLDSGHPAESVFPEACLALFRDVIASEAAQEAGDWIQARQANLWLHWCMVPEKTAEGEVVSVLATGRDVTLLKKAELRIKGLSQALIQAQELERQRIARDLHDHVAQDLAGLKILSESLRIPHDQDPELSASMLRLSDILGNAIESVRNIAYGLRPPTLDSLGLVRTALMYCDDLSERHKIPIDFRSAGLDRGRLDHDLEIHLFRILQEALANGLRHAGASRIEVRLVRTHPDILLRVEDDGSGFDVAGRSEASVEEKRMGMRSMQERAEILGGDFRIESGKGEGTRVFVKIPSRFSEAVEKDLAT